MDPDHISLLEYKLSSNSMKFIPPGKGLATLITSLQDLYWDCKDQGDPIDEKFMEIMDDELDVFQVDQCQKRISNTNAKPVLLTPPPMTPQPTPPRMTPQLSR